MTFGQRALGASHSIQIAKEAKDILTTSRRAMCGEAQAPFRDARGKFAEIDISAMTPY